MIEFGIERGSLLHTGEGFSPTHKITLKYGTEASTFWYLQDMNACSLVEPHIDHGVAKELFEQAQELLVGDFLYFSMGDGNNYYLHRLRGNKFTLKVLA